LAAIWQLLKSGVFRVLVYLFFIFLLIFLFYYGKFSVE
jgi:hypothetical protein